MAQKKWENRNPEREAVIYCLSDPRDDSKRYVGQSINFEERTKGHFRAGGNSLKDQWIRDIRRLGLKPNTEILENLTYKEVGKREKFWIRELRAQGWDLLNKTPGGEEPPLSTVSSTIKQQVTNKYHYRKKCWEAEILAYKSLMEGSDSEKILEKVDKLLPDYDELGRLSGKTRKGQKQEKSTLKKKSVIMKGKWNSNPNWRRKLTGEEQAESNRKKSEANKGKISATHEEYLERGEKIKKTQGEKKARGESIGGPPLKVSLEQRAEIAQRFSNGEKKKLLAKEYGVSPKTITNIVI